VSGRRNRGYNPAVLGLAIAAVLVIAAVFLVGNPFGSAAASPSPGGSESAAGSGTPAPTRLLTGCPTAAPTALAAGESRTVTISTPKGDIVVVVEANLAPVAAANFVALATCGYYDGVVFHRVVPGFVIQGGDGQYAWSGGLDAARAGQGGPGYEFNDEPVVGDYTPGAVAMANSGPNTNGSQFFIVVADQSGTLPKSYTIFGHVTAGMDVVNQIVAAPRNANDFPDDPVPMTTLTVGPGPSPSASPAASAPELSPEAPQP
jgi:cyclophilin family peptidyl-prolyl cis-trans isomerase